MNRHVDGRHSRNARGFFWRAALLLLSSALSNSATAFDVTELMAALSKIEQNTVGFEETKYVAALTQPLVRRGTLHYVRPNQLEMQVDKPYFEKLTIVGDLLTIETRSGTRQLDLSNQPAASAWVESVRSTLAGDLPSLSRHYRSTVAGDKGAWTLDLEPLEPTLAKLVKRISLKGSDADITRISIEEQQGDRTVLVLSALAQASR